MGIHVGAIFLSVVRSGVVRGLTTTLYRSRPLFHASGCFHVRTVTFYSATSSANDRKSPGNLTSASTPPESSLELPPQPTDCCMSGCSNCVWLVYAEQLAQIYKDGGLAAEQVLEAIEDPSLKIFLSLEFREKFKSDL